VKLTKGVNFINILRMNFSYERPFGSFFYVHGSCQNNEKCARRTLMKLATGVNFTNIFSSFFV
jgi:hypothetical protein